MAASGPGCVKTRTLRPIAQQLNPEGRVDESLLQRRPTSRFYISSRPPENSFDTAWTRRRPAGGPRPRDFFDPRDGDGRGGDEVITDINVLKGALLKEALEGLEKMGLLDK